MWRHAGTFGAISHNSPMLRRANAWIFCTTSFFQEEPLRNAEPPRFYLSTDVQHNIPLSPADGLNIEVENDTDALIKRLRVARNLYEQVELLQRLRDLGSMDFSVIGGADSSFTVRRLLEDVYQQASLGDENKRPYWGVVRRAAGATGESRFRFGRCRDRYFGASKANYRWQSLL